jgi:hypothetical protein
MKEIRKYMTSLAAAGFVMAVAVPSHAVFTSKPPLSTLTASATTGGVATIAITSALIKNISNNATVGAIGWSNTAAGFQVADQYVELKTNINTTSGGVQYYTDNTNATGVSKFTGSVSSFTATPAGLVDNTDETQKLPTAWRASSFTITGITASDPNNASDPNSFLWLFHEDKAQVANPSINAAKFNDGDAFVTVYAAPGTVLGGQSVPSSGGIHFAQGPTQFGGFHTTDTTDIYTEADFSTALALTTYSTTKLILEAFSL